MHKLGHSNNTYVFGICEMKSNAGVMTYNGMQKFQIASTPSNSLRSEVKHQTNKRAITAPTREEKEIQIYIQSYTKGPVYIFS